MLKVINAFEILDVDWLREVKRTYEGRDFKRIHTCNGISFYLEYWI